jgi:hypothetical protein
MATPPDLYSVLEDVRQLSQDLLRVRASAVNWGVCLPAIAKIDEALTHSEGVAQAVQAARDAIRAPASPKAHDFWCSRCGYHGHLPDECQAYRRAEPCATCGERDHTYQYCTSHEASASSSEASP